MKKGTGLMDLKIARTLVVHDGERQLCAPCLRVVLFGADVSAVSGLTAPLDAYISRFGSDIGWYRNGFHQANVKRWPKTGGVETIGKMRGEMLLPRGAVGELLAPSKKGEWLAPAFLYWKSGGVSAPFVMMSLPLEWLESVGSDGVDSLIREIAESDFPLASGYVGRSIFWNHSFPRDAAEMEGSFRRWLGEYPGLMHPDPLMQVQLARTGLADVGWYTLLGPALAANAGDAEHVFSRIPAALQDVIKTDHFSSGTMAIRAGAAPVLKDQEPDQTLSPQRVVGAALNGLYDAGTMNVPLVSGFAVDGEIDERRQWTGRFFNAI